MVAGEDTAGKGREIAKVDFRNCEIAAFRATGELPPITTVKKREIRVCNLRSEMTIG